MSVFSKILGGRRIMVTLAAAVVLAGPLAGSSNGDELWNQAKAYTAAVRNMHAQAVQALEDAQDALASAEENLAEAQADLEQASEETSGVLSEIADEAAEAVETAKWGLQLAQAGLKVAEALADIAAGGTAIGQGADYLISWCWDPVCPLETLTGTYEYPTDPEVDVMARLVIQGALDNTLTEEELAEVDVLLPGAGTAGWNYMRAVTRSFAIALRGAGAYSAGNCDDVLAARDDLQVEIGELADSIGPFAAFLEPATTYWSAGDIGALLDDATTKLLIMVPVVPDYPDPVMVHEAIELALNALAVARAELEMLSEPLEVPLDEHFDGYVAGTGIYGQGGWTAWNDDPTLDTPVSAAVCRTDFNSLDVQVGADVLHELPPQDSGMWRFTTWQYIPSDYASPPAGPPYGSSLILLSAYDPAGGHDPDDRSVQMDFDSNDGMLKVYYGNGMNTVNRPYSPDRWVELRAVVDLDNDWTRVYYDGSLVTEYSWTGGIMGGGLGVQNIAAVQLSAHGSTSIFYDDVRLERALHPQPLQRPGGVLPPLTQTDFLDFLNDCAVYGQDALPMIEIDAVNVLMPLLFGTYDGGVYLAPAIAAWDGLGDTGGEAALFEPDGVLRFSEVLTTAVDNHWTLIDLADSPLVQDCQCPPDTDGNGEINVDDLIRVILDWGTDGSAHNGDVDRSGIVDVDDLMEVILGWGPCEA
ncbi:MAG: AAA family ATPase [Planctomycetota bacterium]|jgi:hypothetical protein